VVSVFNLAPRRIGGIETMARELSLQLGELGWTSVLCFRGEPVEPVRQFLQLPNVTLDVIDYVSRWSWSCNRRLASLIGRYRPSILHLNFMDLFAPYAALARLRGVPRVFFTDHISRSENYASERSSVLKRIAYRAAIPASKVFCVSDFVRRCWIESGRFPDDRLATVYNGVDIQRCDRSQSQRDQFREARSIPEEAIVVTQISSMTHEKGCATLLEAAKWVVQAAPQVMFLLAGDGKQRQEYELMSRRLGIQDRVRFLGLVNDPVGEGLFSGSDIVCQASNWHEAFGLSIAEAMACGRPVIATKVGGIPELVRDGCTGVLVDRANPTALADGLIKLAASADLRQMYGDAARRLCREAFDHRANAAKMIEFYGLSSCVTA
jgi:glycosyltransferase involved in cell wall biosynthesis